MYSLLLLKKHFLVHGNKGKKLKIVKVVVVVVDMNMITVTATVTVTVMEVTVNNKKKIQVEEVKHKCFLKVMPLLIVLQNHQTDRSNQPPV